MATQLDTIMTSKPTPKESDPDALVSRKGVEVVRKTDKVGRRGITVANRCRKAGVGFAIVNVFVGSSLTAMAGALAWYGGGGLAGILVANSLVGTTAIGLGVGNLACIYYLGRHVHHMNRCTTERSGEEATFELEEVVTEQPRFESPSPEPESAKGGWLSFSGWFAKPSGTDESVDESPV
ncbi:MAG: hypothetical protein OXF02_00695 [Simkaniaceae bacterium]|nr:hypothetical protein [Simkaniaceae bacterium]